MTLISQPAFAGELIRCERPNTPPITIELNATQKFRASLNCISGKFVNDMTPCAPTGGWGLSAPTGTAQLVEVVYRWQDYMNHIGPVAGSMMSDEKIIFTGGHIFTPSPYVEDWVFTVDRVSGRAMLKVSPQVYYKDTIKLSGPYVCRGVERKF